jgi:hypothetical protein
MSLPPTEAPRLPPRPDMECGACGHVGQHKVVPGTPPHAYRLQCEACARFIKWLPKAHNHARVGPGTNMEYKNEKARRNPCSLSRDQRGTPCVQGSAAHA